MQEVVALRRELAAKHPADYNSSLTESLQDLSRFLRELNRSEEAQQVMLEAVLL